MKLGLRQAVDHRARHYIIIECLPQNLSVGKPPGAMSRDCSQKLGCNRLQKNRDPVRRQAVEMLAKRDAKRYADRLSEITRPSE